MLINRHNYEEYFILYMDNELDATERRMVDEFVKLHPDLQEELSLLLQSKFNPDDKIVYENKQDLLFSNSSISTFSNYEEWLVLYIDNELNETQRAAVERLADESAEVRNTLTQLQRLKLTPESIVFPDKESLYRRDEKKRPVMWWRMAAAAVLLAVAATTAITLINNNNNGEQTGTPVATTESPVSIPAESTTGKTTIQDDKVAGNQASAGVQQQVAINETKNIEPSKQNNQLKKSSGEVKIETAANNTTPKKDKSNNLPQPEYKEEDALMADLGNKNIDRVNTPAKEALTNNPEFRANDAVTKGAIPTSFNGTPEVIEDELPDGKKNKLRGFFRKVTRTFEKRTNIEATDDDDRLLVGGLAIRLK